MTRDREAANSRALAIGQTAEATGLGVKTIRYYEEIGLIPPMRRRTNGGHGPGHRLFSAADIGRLMFIQHARALGLGLRAIRTLVAIAEEQGCPGERPEYGEILAAHRRSIDERIESLVRLRGPLEALMDAERRGPGGGCTWETCGCMDAADPAMQAEPRVRSASHSGRNKGKKGVGHV